MRSMTGFGRGSAPYGDGRLVLEIKTVNHRFLEIRSRFPRELLEAEALIESRIRSKLSRGHCTVHLHYEGPGGSSDRLDVEALSAHLEDLDEVASGRGLKLSDLAPVLAGAPNLFGLPSLPDPREAARASEAAFEDACEDLIAMREAEGGAMAKEIAARLEALGGLLRDIEERAAGASREIFERTRSRIDALLDGTDAAVDRTRLEAEVAFLADRADFSEEIVRTKSHVEQMSALLGSVEPVGRRLEFLLQEAAREANTAGAKAASAGAAGVAVALKAEIEKIREMVQNVE